MYSKAQKGSGQILTNTTLSGLQAYEDDNILFETVIIKQFACQSYLTQSKYNNTRH